MKFGNRKSVLKVNVYLLTIFLLIVGMQAQITEAAFIDPLPDCEIELYGADVLEGDSTLELKNNGYGILHIEAGVDNPDDFMGFVLVRLPKNIVPSLISDGNAIAYTDIFKPTISPLVNPYDHSEWESSPLFYIEDVYGGKWYIFPLESYKYSTLTKTKFGMLSVISFGVKANGIIEKDEIVVAVLRSKPESPSQGIMWVMEEATKKGIEMAITEAGTSIVAGQFISFPWSLTISLPTIVDIGLYATGEKAEGSKLTIKIIDEVEWQNKKDSGTPIHGDNSYEHDVDPHTTIDANAFPNFKDTVDSKFSAKITEPDKTTFLKGEEFTIEVSGTFETMNTYYPKWYKVHGRPFLPIGLELKTGETLSKSYDCQGHGGKADKSYSIKWDLIAKKDIDLQNSPINMIVLPMIEDELIGFVPRKFSYYPISLAKWISFPERIPNEFTPLDLCMVLDRSGSMDDLMGDKKKIQGAKEAASDVVDVLFPHDRVSLIPFSDTATTDIVDFTSDFSVVKAEINQLSADGWTSFGAGLEAALDQFDAHGNLDHIPAILFMSDGVHNTAPDPDAFIAECKNKEIPIYTVGFALSESEVDVTKLKNMADETGGKYLFADNIFELQNIFIGLQHKASGWESEATYTGEVNQGQTVTAGSFDIDSSTKNSRVTLNWPGSDLDLKLFNPDGIPVNLSAPDIIYSGDTKPEYVILKEPQPGTWTVRVYGKVVDSSEDYYVLVTEYVPPGSRICKTQITSDPSLQDRPSIVNANGDYYIAYQSWETGSSYNGDIFIKKYDSKWNEVKKQQITDNSYYQDSPSLVFANNELYVALITNHEGDTWDDYDVYLKKYDSNLNYISGSGRYLTTSQSCQDLPSLFYKDGYFYLTYSSWESGSSYNGNIYIKKFDSSWNQIKKVRITSETSLQTRPSVIYVNGYFYVVYYSKETGNRDIFVKRLDANLNLDSWKKQITSELPSQSFPSISFANNEYAIVYASYETGTIGIYMKKYDINWNFIEKTKIVDGSSAQERRPSHIWDGREYVVSYVHNYTANDDWTIFTMIPGCNEGQLSQTIPLQVSVSETPDPVTSGETSQVTVYVTSSADGLPVQGASVMVSAILGSVTPTSGTTDSNGDFKSTYHAPTVTSPTVCLISATTSKTGYASGSGSDTIIVNPQGQTTYSIPLHAGWNLISLPIMPDDSDVLDVMNSVDGNWNSVWSYEAGTWKRYDLTGPDFLNDLTTTEPGKGYWINMKSDDTLYISGSEPTVKSIPLISGWNLVGYNSLSSMPTTDAMNSIDDNWNSIWSYETGTWKRYDLTGPDFLNDLTTIGHGKGYWIDMKSPDTWILGD